MTRSGAKRAAVAATLANGHAAESSQPCHTLNDAYNRQPESPNTTIRSGLAFGNATFGVISTQYNNPRQAQVAAKFLF